MADVATTPAAGETGPASRPPLIGQPGAIIAPGYGDLAEGMARPSSPV